MHTKTHIYVQSSIRSLQVAQGNYWKSVIQKLKRTFFLSISCWLYISKTEPDGNLIHRPAVCNRFILDCSCLPSPVGVLEGTHNSPWAQQYGPVPGKHLNGKLLNFRTDNSDAWLDIATNGFWGGKFEILLWCLNFNLSTSSNQPVQSAYRRHKRGNMNRELKILTSEHSHFTPLIFTATGSMRNSTT